MDKLFSTLSEQLYLRSARAVVSKLGLASQSLRDHLIERLETPIGSPESFLAQPVFEGLFDWKVWDKPLSEVAFLHPRLVQALDAPVKAYENFRFDKSWKPRLHQYQSWEILANPKPKSVLVATGTASGKTECFMVPVLNSLVEQLESQPSGSSLEGVQAIFLYPLNALIHSQRNRLSAWTSSFQNKLRFALYNGLTPENVPAAKQKETPWELVSRDAIRTSPPPILVTNASMLEYMLIRKADQPILQKSAGKLRWIILDEAHSYLGSSAADVALQLRRVMNAFQVTPEQVRFVATSATIGDASKQSISASLREFLADLSGVELSRVHVIQGERIAPTLSPSLTAKDNPIPSIEDLSKLPSIQQFEKLAENKAFREIRQRLENGHLSLREISTLVFKSESPDSLKKSIALLDVASSCTANDDEKYPAFLPLRSHFFTRTMQGLWACCNPKCGQAPKNSAKDWGFGALFLERQSQCKHCGSLCFELVVCSSCGEAYLLSEEDNNKLLALGTDDELEQLPEGEQEEPDEEESLTEPKKKLKRYLTHSGKGTEFPFNRHTGELDDESKDAVSAKFAIDDDQIIRCTRCGTSNAKDQLFISVRFGQPFFLGNYVPTLLEFESPAQKAQEPLPAEGRRLLTFSDSRQGSARFALSLQLSAERGWTRGYVYHKVWEQTLTNQQGSPRDLEEQIRNIKQLPQTKSLENLVYDLRRKLEEIQQGKSVSWKDMITGLAECQELKNWSLETFIEHYPPARELGKDDLANIFLLREFARRPRRANSLETLGMVALVYPALNTIRPPPAWTEQLNEQDWPVFLKIILDYFVRANGALIIKESHERYLGTNLLKRTILPPESEPQPKCVVWPAAKSRRPENWSRIPKYLAQLLQKTNSAGLDERVNYILREAFKAITTTPILEVSGDGFRMNLSNQGAFRAMRTAWVCPVTGRALDATLDKQSPFIPKEWSADRECKELQMPEFRFYFPKQHRRLQREILEFLDTDKSIETARNAGIWSPISDRIATFAPSLFFRSGEHSAQQSHTRLTMLEGQFNQHKLNVLSCSTTMEMGVDIGGLNMVGMNNVPPAPSNYRQRAGRAGRSKNNRAVVVTLCNTTPHGEEVFSNTDWPFTSSVLPPSVSLHSERIVQRHVNALLLGYFLAPNEHADNQTLSCKAFFGEDAKLSESFLAFIERARNQVDILAALTNLTKRTVLENQSTDLILTKTIDTISEVQTRWRMDHSTILEPLTEMGGIPGANEKNIEPARRAMYIQLQRHEGEYLLKYLVSEGILPSHGFPTRVVPFVTTTFEQMKSYNKELQQREDNQVLSKGFPSRHLSVAIREYAPGAVVVLDGMVYRSGGITLNWKKPASEQDTHEIQALRWFHECDHCGVVTDHVSRKDTCDVCGNEMRSICHILPAGFAVDLWSKPTNDLAERTYIPLIDNHVSVAGGAWVALGGSYCGRFRDSPNGKVVYRSGGENGYGYALCLHCGRAAPETEPPCRNGESSETLPEELRNHRRLRSGKKGDMVCTGQSPSYAVRRNIRLGGYDYTDVLEVQLCNPKTRVWIGSDEDQTVATTIAVVLRRALAETLGIDPRELGWSVRSTKSETAGKVSSLLLYDSTQNGAGYVAIAKRMWPRLLQSALRFLECPRGCNQACHGCLVGFDTQQVIQLLNRHLAKQQLATIVEALALPPEIQVWGDATTLEYRSGHEVFLANRETVGIYEWRIHLGGDATEWNFEQWPLLSVLREICNAGGKVTLVVSSKSLTALSWKESVALERFLSTYPKNASVTSINGAGVSIGKGLRVMELLTPKEVYAWAITATKLWAPNSEWGVSTSSETRLLKGIEESPVEIKGQSVKPQDLVRLPDNVVSRVEFDVNLSGTIKEVGKKFWGPLCSASPLLKQKLETPNKLTKVVVVDRYLRHPLGLRVLFELLLTLKGFAGGVDTHTKVKLFSRPVEGSHATGKIPVYCDFPTENMQKDVVKRIWKQLGLEGELVLDQSTKHDREIQLTWDQQEIMIDLSHGLTFFRVEKAPLLNLTTKIEQVLIEFYNSIYDFSVKERSAAYIRSRELVT